MIKEREVVGGFIMHRLEVRPFTDKQIALVQNFAAQAVIAMENARLLNELQHRTRDLQESLEYQTATSDVLKVISRSTFDLQPVLDALVKTAAQLCDADMAAIGRPVGDLWRMAANFGFPSEFEAYQRAREPYPLDPMSPTVAARALREKAPVHIHDVAAVPGYPEASIRLGKQRTSLGVPLLRDGEAIGHMVIARQRVEPFTDRQIELVRTFADQAVIAMENARLLDELHQRSTDLQEALDYQTAISEVLRVISGSTFDLEPVFGTVAATAVRLCRAHQAGIYLRQDGEYRWAGGFSQLPDYEKIEREVRIGPGSGTLVGRVALEGHAVQILDAWTDPLYEVKEDARVGAIHTLLGVPLLRDGQTLGVIGIARQEVEPFTDRQIKLVSTFADQAVIAIENTRLLNEQREALEQQTATAEVLGVINASPGELQPVFDAMVARAMRLCEASMGELVLFEGENITTVAMRGVPPAHVAFRSQPKSIGDYDQDTIPTRLLAGERILHIPDLMETDAYRRSDASRHALVHLASARSVLAVALSRESQIG